MKSNEGGHQLSPSVRRKQGRWSSSCAENGRGREGGGSYIGKEGGRGSRGEIAASARRGDVTLHGALRAGAQGD
jgi:hypothetical protein